MEERYLELLLVFVVIDVCYPANLNPSTIFVLNARWIGKIEAAIPIIKAALAARTRVEGVMKKYGKNPFGTTASMPATIGYVSSTPAPAPSAEINNDSPKMSPNKCPPENPSVFSTAYSLVRSRADMIMVLLLAFSWPMPNRELRARAKKESAGCGGASRDHALNSRRRRSAFDNSRRSVFVGAVE